MSRIRRGWYILSIIGYAIILGENPALGTTIEVCPECEINSIQAAIYSARDGDTILVREGKYFENDIQVDRSLTIWGENYPIIDGRMGDRVLTILADNVVVSGLHIKNIGVSHLEDRAGIRVKDAENFLICGNRLSNTFFGIYIEHAAKGIIANNVVTGDAKDEMSSGNAIHLWYCEDVTIRDNILSNHRDGIYLEFVDSSAIYGNISKNNLRYGLHFMFSNDDRYFNNSFISNGAGVAVMFSKNIDMRRNLFDRNWGNNSYGLLLKEIYDAEIEHNIFRSNSIAIYIEGSTRITYRRNHFERNGWSIKMSGGCLDNHVVENNFVANTFDLSIQSNPNNNAFDGNFWSDYDGYDLDKDGVGDVPHRPVKLFNYVVNRTPEAIVLLRSLFIDILNFSERISPGLTPAEILDEIPMMSMCPIAPAGAS